MGRPLSLPNLLKKAIETQDWGLAQQALERLTTPAQDKAEAKPKPKKNLKDKLAEPKAPNKFVDDFTIAAEHIEASKKLAKKIKGKEYRAPYRPLTLDCQTCGAAAEILPAELSKYKGPEAEEFNCNKCLQKKLKNATS